MLLAKRILWAVLAVILVAAIVFGLLLLLNGGTDALLNKGVFI